MSSIKWCICLALLLLLSSNLWGQQSADMQLDSKQKEANIVFVGEFYTARGPCQFLADGSRITRWRFITEFKVIEVVSGKIGVSHIDANVYDLFQAGKLISGNRYKVFLKLDAERIKLVEDEDTIFTHLNFISKDEVIDIQDL